MCLALYISRALSGPSIFNIPYWNGLGILCFYVSYAGLGIRFSNGISLEAELILSLYLWFSVISFAIGEIISGGFYRKASFKLQSFLQQPRSIPPLPNLLIFIFIFISLVFFVVLTRGNVILLFTSSVELKFERLNSLMNKDPILLNLDQIVLALSIICSGWAWLEADRNHIPIAKLLVVLFFSLLYVFSTGSRSPLISFVMQFVIVSRFIQFRIPAIARFLRNRLMLAAALLGAVLFLIFVTNQRIQFEKLDVNVFLTYFSATSFGAVEDFLASDNPVLFLLGTLVSYSSSTFNNFILRYQEIGLLNPSFGYKFFFFYIAAIQILLPGMGADFFRDWKSISTFNMSHLESFSMGSGQWSTSYGDLIWDYGVYLTFILVFLWGIWAGFLVGKARNKPSFLSIMWLIIVTEFSLLPLVNPFQSLYVHYAIIILLLLGAFYSRVSLRRP